MTTGCSTVCHVIEVRDEEGFIAQIRNGQAPSTPNAKLTYFKGDIPTTHSTIFLLDESTRSGNFYRVLYHLFYLSQTESDLSVLKAVLVYVVRIRP